MYIVYCMHMNVYSFQFIDRKNISFYHHKKMFKCFQLFIFINSFFVFYFGFFDYFLKVITMLNKYIIEKNIVLQIYSKINKKMNKLELPF